MAPRTKTRLCRKCKKAIPPSVVVDGVRRALWIRKYCLDCSPWGAGNSRKLELLRTDGLKTCVGCHKDFPKGSFKRNGFCKTCLAKKAKAARNETKRQCVAFLGGKCVRCGYKRSLAALDFHHRDPKKKDFEVGRMKGTGFEKLKKELLKCDLLCRNCHAEAHFPEEVDETEPVSPLASAAG